MSALVLPYLPAPKRIAWFCPAYRGQINIETAFSLVRDTLWARENGHEIIPFYRATTSIDASRNFALRQAIGAEADYLLMIDADVYADGSPLRDLLAIMGDTGAAAVGAAVASRRYVGHSNANPEPQGNEPYEGEVGTGLMLIDIKQVSGIQAPWFVTSLQSDGITVACGEDIHFCRLLKRRDRKVMIAPSIRTSHVAEQPLTLSPMSHGVLTAQPQVSDDGKYERIKRSI